MKEKEWNVAFLILSVSTISFLGWFVNSFPPLAWWSYIVFFLLLGGFLYTISFFFFGKIRLSLLITVGVISFFILRALNLRHPLYMISLLIVFLFAGAYLKHKKI